MAVALLQIMQSIFGPDFPLYVSYFAALLAIVGVLVKLTPTKKDDEILAKVQEFYSKYVENQVTKPEETNSKTE